MTANQYPKLSVLAGLAALACLAVGLLMFVLWTHARSAMQEMAREKEALSQQLAIREHETGKTRSGPLPVAQSGGGFPLPDQDGWRTLVGLGNVVGWQPYAWQPSTSAADRPIVDGCLCISDGRAWYGDEAGDVIIKAQVRKISGQNLTLRLRYGPDGEYAAYFNGGDSFGIGKKLKDAPFANLETRNVGRNFDDGFFEMKLSAIKDTLVLYANGEEIARAQDQSLRRGRIGLGAFGGMAIFKNVQVQILDEQR